MPKYKLLGFITETITMEVEADNLEEAIEKCEQEYDFDEFDTEQPIIKNGEPILDKNEWAMDLQDIDPEYRHLY